MKYLLSFFLTFLLINNAVAYEPPSSTIEEAIKNGEIAFIGKIIKLEELSDSENFSTAMAKVKIIQCFYGILAQKDEITKIKYYSRVFSDVPNPGFPADFQVSDVIFFVFNNKQDLEKDYLIFNSFWKNPLNQNLKIDLAYYASDDPNERYTEQRNEHAFTSIYMQGAASRPKLENLFKLVETRKTELSKK
ncbi:hypothetical protein [Desulfogranum japonicum]|uniref:hypothetical protein n=1 Tax=Desulfogranum japonicum TaxID=231447 RepID=UPI00040B12F2|nr:hypothetical protein [Desulfogranum japonicum]